MKYIVSILLIVMVGMVFPQDEGKKSGQQKSPAVEDSMELPAGEFVYKPMGRRDPFWDLLKGKNVKGTREAIEGIEGLMIDELDLEGIIFAGGKYRALFKGPDGLPYGVLKGQKVYDGEIIRIDRHSVLFKKILTIALGGKNEKLIEKRLNPDEEEGKK